jgi:large subunit ribosomal protein L6
VSRIGKYPVAIPKGVKVTLSEGPVIEAKGPKGEARLDCRGHVKVCEEDGRLRVERHSDSRQDLAYHGLYRRLLAAMVKGVSEGFTRELDLVGIGYRAAMDGKTLVLNLGYSHEIRVAAPEGIVLAAPAPNKVTVSGHDKQAVGQLAANIRALRPPEPYKGKGIRYSGEHVRRKVGKAGA